MDYLDFELEIDTGSGREYPVRVINSPAGEAREIMYFPFSELELENKLQALQIALLRSGGQRRQSLSPEQRTVQDFGRALFDALLNGEVRGRYDVSLRDATLQGRGLRLKLRVNAPEMAALPWEFLYDTRSAEYVCLSQETPIVRYLELPRPIHALTVTPPLRILGMVASPSDAGVLNVALEKQRVETALRDLQAAGLVELTWLGGATWRALQQAMRRGQWHVFHFIGHGDFDAGADEGLLLLCTEDGRAQRMHATALARLLANHRTLRLALLNACESGRGSARDLFSSTASILVRRGIPAVLAMQYAITDRAAIEFARTFYESLVDGFPVDAAVVESRVAISLAVHNTVEWGTPVLYMRSPDGVLFKMQDAGSKVQDAGGKRQDAEAVATISKSRSDAPRVPLIPQPKIQNPQSTTQNPQLARLPFEPEMILIPAGEFLMGSDPQKDKEAKTNEQPQHKLYLPDYYIAKTPVTNAQYAAFVKATGYKSPQHWKNGAIPQRKEAHPVVYVNWEDAIAYCRWLAEKTGKPYMLPSEAEWEKAARGKNGRLYPWGNTFSKIKCNVEESGIRDTTPVEKYLKAASPYGVLDMAGNVWEWTRSQWKGYPYDPMADREDVLESAVRVVRGGAFDDVSRVARCACRFEGDLLDSDWSDGFRVMMATEIGSEGIGVKQQAVKDESRAACVVPLVTAISERITRDNQSVKLARLPFEPEMILIPAGEFLMGSDPQKDKDACDSEQPQHTLYLPVYWIAKTPVTNAQYAVFVQATGHGAPGLWQADKIPQGKDTHPVVYVTWHDALAYCTWLAEATGKPYTLPSEAEWEKAARGTDGRFYPWGDTFDKSKCNAEEFGFFKDTTPVDKYPQGASPYGVFDMAGNVYEWTCSLWGPWDREKSEGKLQFVYPYQFYDGRENLEADDAWLRVLRSGSSYGRFNARCAYRRGYPSIYREVDWGFRVVVSPPRA